MFDEYCDYCHKPIKKNDYLVHLRYPTFSGILNEYYHKSCFDSNRFYIWYHGIHKRAVK